MQRPTGEQRPYVPVGRCCPKDSGRAMLPGGHHTVISRLMPTDTVNSRQAIAMLRTYRQNSAHVRRQRPIDERASRGATTGLATDGRADARNRYGSTLVEDREECPLPTQSRTEVACRTRGRKALGMEHVTRSLPILYSASVRAVFLLPASETVLTT